MKTIVLISCGKTKHHSRSRASNLYRGDLFKKSLAYARSLEPDAIYILSAKHGLVGLDDELDPYELTLTKMGIKERRAWAKGVCEQLSEHVDLTRDRLIFLAGDVYRKHLTPFVKTYSMPLEGLSFGRQLAWLGANSNV
ncbi:DUF6884 domain-containing protein [Mesorhizobium sp.]|uniref:DUF6884 domain-containing protein n=1 Tax=Mesorhizobium sp. TaxID=1871066 RepID=UPI000FE945F4|nr:DUF6884 domain-containing protein [Mesorhizobium sp.]RWN37530.1 MAG: hypothetical protein EOR95_04915 [Mesorhizobium sp.]